MTQRTRRGSGVGAMGISIRSGRGRRTASPSLVAGLLLSAWGAMSCGGKTHHSLDASQRGQDAAAAADSDSGSSGSEASHATRDGEADTDVPGLDDAEADSGITPPDAGPTDAGSVALGERLSELLALPAWQDFKALWQRLDEVLPNDGGSSSHASTISAEERAQWLLELDSSLRAIEQSGTLNDDELLFLRRATTARVEVMMDGGYLYEMFYHRLPFPFELETEDSIARLETKIDTLLALRERCQVDGDAYQRALEQIEREAITFFAVAQLADAISRETSVPQVAPGVEGAELVAELEAQLTNLRESSSGDDAALAEIAAMQERLAAVRRTLDALPQLVRELERCS